MSRMPSMPKISMSTNAGNICSLNLSKAAFGQDPLNSGRIGFSDIHCSIRPIDRLHLGVDASNLLNRASFAGALMFGSDDASISTLSELLDELVLGVDDKRLIEGLE